MRTVICLALCMTLMPIGTVVAEDAGNKSMDERILGYWAPDMEVMADDLKRMAKELAVLMGAGRSGKDPAPAEKAALEEIVEGFSVMTVEIRKGEILEHIYPGEPDKKAYTIKAQDEEAGTVELAVAGFGGSKSVRKIKFKGEQLVFVSDEGELSMVFNRIDGAAFKERQQAASESELFKEQPGASGGPKRTDGDKDEPPGPGEGKAAESSGGYPVARPVPQKPGYAFSPYSNHVIDVRDIPAGTLVQDPAFPASEMKFFRVPEFE